MPTRTTTHPNRPRHMRRAHPGLTGARRWPLERALFLLAGTMVLLTTALAVLVTPWLLLLTAFVGLSQLAYVATGACPASLVLTRLGFEPAGGCR